MIAIVMLFVLGIAVFYIASIWTIYKKANKPGWTCLIPIYNIIVLLEIVHKPWWWIFLLLIPFVNIIFAIIVTHNLSLAFGKDAGFTVGLLLLGFIFYPILAFGDAQYHGEITPGYSSDTVLDANLK